MSPPPSSGSVPAPNTFTADYPSLFGDQGIDRCPGEALESSFGPFAYAESLLVIVRRLEATIGTPPASPLASRRPDIPGLLLDEPTLNRRVPRLSLAIECLEAMVEATHDGNEKAAALLAAATSPANLPFDRAWTLVGQVLKSKRQHPWQLLRQTDEDYPNFSQRTIVNPSMRSALTLCTGLAPAQLRQLQATPPADESALWFRLGLPAASTLEGLSDSATFLKAMGLNRKRLRQLLAVNGVAKQGDNGSYSSVTVSEHGKPGGQPDSGAFGARFINGGRSPRLRLVAGGAGGKATRIENLGAAHLHRINAVLRLHTGTGLPFAALDRLLQAVFGAQGQDTEFQIDVHALRALGLYCHLRDSRRVDLAAFAAVLHEISPYATGRDTSYYDKLFCAGAGSNDLAGPGSPLTMDGGVFANAGSDPTMQRLCSGLGVSADTLSVLLQWAIDARESAAPARNLSLISSCHRLAVLPRWLGHDEKAGIALLRLFKHTQPDLFALLAGLPMLARGAATDAPDIVDAIVTLMNLADWLRQRRLDAMSLLSVLDNQTTPENNLVRRIPDLSAQAHAVTDNRLREAFLEMPFAEGGKRRPTELLSSLVDNTGLFKDTVFEMDRDTLEMEVELALDPARDTTAGNLATITAKFERTRQRVGQRLAELLEGQRSLVENVLETLLPGIPDPLLRASLARWVGASATAVLGLLRNRRSPGETAVVWLDALRQRAQLVSLLAIDASTIEAMRSRSDRFDLDNADIQNPGLILVHRLTEWNATVRDVAARSGLEEAQARSELLTYLATARDTVQGDPATRLARLLHVDVAVVASVAGKLAGATPGSLTTTRHVAWLLRLQALAERTTISIDALLALAHLEPQSEAADIEAAGRRLLATCETSERDVIVGMHNQAWRDALIAWLLPRATDMDERKFVNANELSAWLLTDLEVGPEPETTRLAAAIDSLQLYIHRLLSGLEKHLNPRADVKKERQQWSAYRSRYVDWRQYRERREYPENHIHPVNRQRKTGAFLDLETQLAQGQARPADIDTTLLRYLADFERTSNIQVISAYHDGIDPTHDELHLIGRSNIEPYEYFWQSARMDVKADDGHTGMLSWSGWKKVDLPINGELTRSRIPRPPASASGTNGSPRGSIKALEAALREQTTAAEAATKTAEDLRKAVDSADDKVAAEKAASDADTTAAAAVEAARATRTAWTVARYDEDDSRDTIETIRPMTIDGRKYVVWVERDSSAIVFDDDNKASEYYVLRVCYSYLDTNNNWSASNTLLTLDGRLADGTRPKPTSGTDKRTLFTRSYLPGLIIMENRKGQRETDPYLVAMLFDSARDANSSTPATWKADEDYFLAVRDLLLIDEKRLDGASKDSALENRLVANWYSLFRDPRVVQHPYIGAKYELKFKEGEQTTTETVSARLDALAAKLLEKMRGTESVNLAATLTGDGQDIEVTGIFDDVWSPKLAPRADIRSVNDIAHISVDHVITIEEFISYRSTGSYVGKVGDVVAECVLRASIAADSWDNKTIHFDSIDIKNTNDNLLSRYAHVLPHSRRTSSAVDIIEYLIEGLDISAKSLEINLTLADLLESKNLAYSTGSAFRSLGREGTALIVKDKRRGIPCTLWGSLLQELPIPIKAELIRVGTAQQPGTGGSGATALEDLKASYPAMDLKAMETVHALATADRTALTAWLPLLTDTWRIPGSDYYEALRNVGLEFGNANDSPLSGELPFLQAMHATNRETLRESFVGLVADTLGTSLPDVTRAKLPSDCRTALVRFAASEQASYRDLLGRLAKLVAGNTNDVVIATEVLDAHARGPKRIVARIPVNTDETDYTFRLVLSATDDPTTRTDNDTYHEWIRLTAPYTLTNVTEASTQLPDDRVPTARIRRNRAQAQYLDLDESGMPPIRLNTLFGKQLVARATRSVDAALSIDAQTLPEPALRAGGSGGFVDFRGANGLYFWELFFHVPWLVAWSLREKGHYAEAWRWCSRYLFDPYRGRTTETTAPVPFWNCLPLVYPLDGARDTGETPELAGYANAIAFRKAIHAFLVDLWRMEGDEQFRRLSPDTLREANLCYQKAMQLIGTLQEPTEAKPWTPTTLGSRSATFVQPVDRALGDRRALLLARLENLRHGRTIDGVLIPYLGYGDEDAESGWSGGRRGSTGGLRVLALHTIPAYRFREVVAMALAAVERLTDLGRYLFRIYEHEADDALEVERLKNLVALADFDISLKRKAVETARRECNTLQLSQLAVQTRIKYLSGQLELPRSAMEIAGTTTAAAGIALQLARLIPIGAKGGVKSLPKIFGMAMGNAMPEAICEATSEALGASAEGLRLLAEDLRVEAAYNRRNEDWAHDKTQAEHDLAILTSQLEEQTSRSESATIELNGAIRQRDALRSEFEVQTTGFAVASTYTWMLGRLGELLASAYQSVFTLCLDAEASYRYETGDFDSRHVRLDAWNGARRGMFAGEALQNDLQAMQAAFLRCHVRRLGIHKTVSLKNLFGKDETNKDKLTAALTGSKLSFDLDEKLFDADFPGHYLRQIRHLAVVLVPKEGAATLTADTEIRAVLTQSSSTLLYRPDPRGAEWLYDPSKGSAEAILRDLRGDQQTVLSHASPRPGADPMETIVLRTEYADGRYGTFEGTGAISSWTLSFPGDEINAKHIRDQIDDIEIRLDYAAAWGGTEFKEKVDSLLEATRTGSQTPPGPSESTGDTSAHTPPPAPALTYPAPVMREVRARHAIDRRDVPDGATVTVVPWPSIREGQQVWLRCMGTRADGTSLNRALRSPSTPVTADETTQGIEATIPLGYLEALGDYAQLRVVCKVSLDSSGVLSAATTFPELVLDLPKCVSLSVTMTAADKHWVLHTSPAVPSMKTRAGYLALFADEGPTGLARMPSSPTVLSATVLERDAQTEHTVHVRAGRLAGKGGSYGMNDYSVSVFGKDISTHSADTYLRIQCLPADNAELPPGAYAGRLVLQLTGEETPRVIESIFVNLDLTVTPPSVADPELEPIDDAPAPLLYPMPVVREVRARNALDRRDIDVATGATMTIAPWPGIAEGQRIWLRCEGLKTDPVTGKQVPDDLDLFPLPRAIGAAEAVAGLSVPLPFDYVDGLGDYGQLRIVFKAALSGRSDELSATPFPVLVLDIPKRVALSITTAQTDTDWVAHTSPATPWIPTHAGYLALSEEVGPTAHAWSPESPTYLKTVVTADDGRTEYKVRLRARRLWGPDGSFGMNGWGHKKGDTTYSRETYFRIQCLTADNAALPPGTYKGKLTLQLTGKEVPVVLESLLIDISITV